MASVKTGGGIPVAVQTIETIPARSSWIAEFEYDATNLRLTTHLKDGSIHQHTFVTAGDWINLKTAKSHGGFFSNNILGKKQGIRVKSAKKPHGKVTLGEK